MTVVHSNTDTTAGVDRCLADATDAWNGAPNSVLRVG